MKNKKLMKKLGITMLVLGLVATTGIGAYLTSTDVQTDVYTIGSVEIVNNFVASNTENMVALDVIHYNTATITNTGINDAYVFMTVDIPVASVYTHSADGTGVIGPDMLELFVMGNKSNEWVQVGDVVEIYDGNDDHIANRYVFAYGALNALSVLPSGETSSDVFTTLQLINIADIDKNGQSIVNNSLEEGESLSVELNAYAIQAGGLGNDTSAATIWNIICNTFSLS